MTIHGTDNLAIAETTDGKLIVYSSTLYDIQTIADSMTRGQWPVSYTTCLPEDLQQKLDDAGLEVDIKSKTGHSCTFCGESHNVLCFKEAHLIHYQNNPTARLKVISGGGYSRADTIRMLTEAANDLASHP